MRTNWQTFPVSFQGGLITNLGLIEHGSQFPGSARKLVNFEPSIGGGYKKVLGYRKWIDEPVPGTGTIQTVCVVPPNVAIAARGDKFYYTDDQTTWSAGFDAGNAFTQRIRHTTYNFGQGETVVFVDGVNSPTYFDVATNTFSSPVAHADITGSSFVAAFADRLFFAKGPLLTYSNLLSDVGFDPALGAGTIKVKSDITGLVVFRDTLIIFGEDCIDKLSGTSPSDFVVTAITRKTGCSWPDSIQEVGGDILYKAADGVRYLSATEKNDDFALERASEAIQTEVNSLFVSSGAVSSTVIRGKAQYRLFYHDPEGGATLSQGFLGTRFQDQSASGVAWSTLTGFNVYVADSKQQESEELILFSDGTNYVYQMEWGFSFDGNPIFCHYETPYLIFDDPRVRKTFYKHHCYTEASGSVWLDTKLTLDFNDDGTIQPPAGGIGEVIGDESIYGVGTYGSAVYKSPVRTQFSENLIGSGFSASISYTDNSDYPSFTLSSMVLEYRQNDKK